MKLPVGLVLRTAGDGVGDVAEDPVVADEGGKVVRLQHVNHRHELGGVDSVTCELSRHG